MKYGSVTHFLPLMFVALSSFSQQYNNTNGILESISVVINNCGVVIFRIQLEMMMCDEVMNVLVVVDEYLIDSWHLLCLIVVASSL